MTDVKTRNRRGAKTAVKVVTPRNQGGTAVVVLAAISV